jgi:amino acid permease
MKNFFLAIGIITGTIVGAGIFPLPYIFVKLGFLTGLFYLIFFAFIYYFIHIKYLEILDSERLEEHHFLYFSKKYLSKFWGKISSWLIILELVLSLTIYLILSKIFANLAFGFLGTTPVLFFWFIGSLFIFSKDSWVGWAEMIGGFGILFIILFIILKGGEGSFNINLFESINFSSFLVPFGPLLFAFSGRAAISKVVELSRESDKKDKFSVKKAVFWGTFLPIFIYLLFIFGILKLTPVITADGLSGLINLPKNFLLGVSLVGFLTMWTSYMVLGSNLFDILRFDLKGKNWLAGLVVFLAPISFYFLGLNKFISAVSLTGGLFLAVQGIFIITIWFNMKGGQKLSLGLILLYLIFGMSIVYQILSVFGVSI